MKEKFDLYLSHILDYLEDGRVKKAMLYSLLNNGKRLRPLLLLNALKDLNENIEDAFIIAGGIEMIHTYSLIHDDLPAMDNDDFRRGKKTCHREFDEATAILAGDGLLSEAFNMIFKSNYDSDIKVKLLEAFTKAAGVNGMIKGQELDIYSDEFSDLRQIDWYKTGCLIALPLICASIITRNDAYQASLSKMGYLFGVAFQIQDDVLDVTSTMEVLGKAINSDAKNNKNTYPKMLGINKCNELIDNYYEQINNMFINEDIKMLNVLELINGFKFRKY